MIHHIAVMDGEVRVRLKGKFDVDAATTIREQLFPLLDKGFSRIVVCLSEVTCIDSSGLGVLVALQKRANANGGGLRLKHMQDDVRELVALTRLTELFEMD